MLKIKIAERLKPFSHVPGSACLIPGTRCQIEAFPSLFRLHAGENRCELNLQLEGGVKGFTLEQNLEKNCVFVFGHTKKGFYRFQFRGSENGIEMEAKNLPSEGLLVNEQPFRRGAKIPLFEKTDFFIPSTWERLSLGVSKKQDWEMVLRRFDLKEIIPVLFGLGQKIPPIQSNLKAINDYDLLFQRNDLESFCRGAFSKILIPRFFDDQYQGIFSGQLIAEDPCFLFQAAFDWIRSLLFRQNGDVLTILPSIQFETGRLTQIQVSKVGEMDLEWASGCLRQAVLRASQSFVGKTSLFFNLPKKNRSFRMRELGSRLKMEKKSGDPVIVESGKTYFFDRFQV